MSERNGQLTTKHRSTAAAVTGEPPNRNTAPPVFFRFIGYLSWLPPAFVASTLFGAS
jgi:hypothetical protein